jgi:hypothetical protein
MLDNIKPQIWGKHLWATGYLIAYSYPNNPTHDDKNIMLNFFNQFKYIIPCEKCRVNFSKHILKFPLDDLALTNKYSLINWFMNINNEVNIMLGKNILTMNDIYNKYYQSPTNYNKKIITSVLVFILIIILIGYMIFKRKCNQ